MHMISDAEKGDIVVAALAGRRSLSMIARDIRRSWPKVYFAAAPYLEAMATMDSITDDYGCDSGQSIVRYFLGNAKTWHGEDAKRIKAELKKLAGMK